MAVSMLELFRTLTSFSPKRVDLRGAPWEPFVDWAIGQGLAPLAAYNLEYRLGGGSSVPEWVRHRLLSLYQGSANDNVMKLVNLKQSLAELEGRKLVMLGGVSFAESVYPHIAFRPVIDARLYVPSTDLEPLATWLRRAEFKPIEAVDRAGAQKVLSDTRTQLFLHGRLFDDAKQDVALLSRVLPMRPFGASAYRLELEDALLVHVMLMSRQGFEVPMLEFIDLRELVLGAPSMGGAYSREPDVAKILSRAAEWKVERGLYAALGVVERLWPETAEIVTKLRPSLSLPVRELLDRVVVAPLSEIGRTEDFKGAETLRSLLAGD